MRYALCAELFDIPAIQFFIDSDEPHVVPLRIGVKHSNRVQRAGIREKGRRQPKKDTDKQH